MISVDNWHVSYIMDKTYRDCPYHETNKCPLKRNKRVRSGNVSKTQIDIAKMQQQMNGDEYEEIYRFRNGVEAIPKQLRRNQNIHKMLFRGLLRKKKSMSWPLPRSMQEESSAMRKRMPKKASLFICTS